MKQGPQGCETITADLGLRGVVLEAKYCIVMVLVFDAVCDLDIFMNDNAYATNIITYNRTETPRQQVSHFYL